MPTKCSRLQKSKLRSRKGFYPFWTALSPRYCQEGLNFVVVVVVAFVLYCMSAERSNRFGNAENFISRYSLKRIKIANLTRLIYLLYTAKLSNNITEHALFSRQRLKQKCQPSQLMSIYSKLFVSQSIPFVEIAFLSF